jgi:hypothetical protein
VEPLVITPLLPLTSPPSLFDCPIRGVSSIFVTTVDSFGAPLSFTLLNALYIPYLVERSKGTYLRLLIIRMAADAGLNFTFSSSKDYISYPPGLTIDLVRLHNLIWLPVLVLEHVLLASTTSPIRDLIHRRCGHLHESGLLKLDSLGILGVSGYSKLSPLSFCPDRATAKSTIANINRRSTLDRDPPYLFHTLALDIWSPTSTHDPYGYRSVLGIICYTNAAIVAVLLKVKSDAPSAWTDIISSIAFFGYKPIRV